MSERIFMGMQMHRSVGYAGSSTNSVWAAGTEALPCLPCFPAILLRPGQPPSKRHSAFECCSRCICISLSVPSWTRESNQILLCQGICHLWRTSARKRGLQNTILFRKCGVLHWANASSICTLHACAQRARSGAQTLG